MDLTTIAAALLMAFGLLGVNAVMHANSVIVEVAAPPKSDRINIDQATLEQEFDTQLWAIAKTPSVVMPPEIRAGNNQGIGMAIAKQAKLEDVAYALESELGYLPDRLRLALYIEDSSLRGVVSVTSSRVGNLRQVMIPQKNEAVLDFVNRCAIWAASQIAPYLTSLYLLQKHAGDKNFIDVIELVESAKSKLPPTPVNADRSALDNLLGIVALFQSDPKEASAQFQLAMAEDPGSVTAILNTAFVEVQLEDDSKAAERMERLVTDAPPPNKILLATAYMTWGAAQVGLHNLKRADELLTTATTINPDSSTAWELLAVVKDLRGDQSAGAELHRKAQQAAATFENYGEVAALYFRLAWQGDQPIMHNTFTNPKIVTFH